MGCVETYANEAGIKLIGDIPIFLALDSADVWCQAGPVQAQFGRFAKSRVLAFRPIIFQRPASVWGNPIYDWDTMLRMAFAGGSMRFRHSLKIFDIVRIDHFRGFVAAWEVPGKDKTAENGKWVSVPGRELFTAVKQALGDLPLIAEDLGVMTPEVEHLRDDFRFPGIRILQYAFSGDARNRDLPQ